MAWSMVRGMAQILISLNLNVIRIHHLGGRLGIDVGTKDD